MALCGFRSRELHTRYSSVNFWTIYIHIHMYVQVIKKGFFKFICLVKTNWFYASAGLHSYIIYRFCIHPIILKRNIASLQWSHMNDLYIIMKLSQISTLELRYTIGYWTLDKRLCQNHTLESGYDLKFIYWAKRTTLTTNQKWIQLSPKLHPNI